MSVIFQNCRVFDGAGDVARDGLDVIVKGDRIAVIKRTGVHSIEDHDRVPGAGRTLIPGLIDCHAHYLFDPSSPSPFVQARDESDAMTVLRGARNVRSALRSGVTTTREAGAPRQLNFPLRDAIASGLIPGPRILAPGEAITITGGHGLMFGREADGIDELTKIVRQQMRDGADVVKIVASEAAMLTTPAAAVEELTAEEIGVLVAEARRRGLRIFSHAQNSTSVIRSARAGVDSVEHGYLGDVEATAVLAETGTALVPTLTVTTVTLERPDLEPAFRRRMLQIQESQWASCERAIREGVNVLAGTDCGVPGVFPEMLWREVVLLNERGLSKPDALKAATSRAAELLGVEDEVGRVEVGKQADLVLLAGDPLEDLTCLASPELVMKAGKIVY